jgi:hypothetical protein
MEWNNIDVAGSSYTWAYERDAENTSRLKIKDSSDVTVYDDQTKSDMIDADVRFVRFVIMKELRSEVGNSLDVLADASITVSDTNVEISMKAKLDYAMNRLDRIAHPIKWIGKDAEATGHQVDGIAANNLANDPNYLRHIAEDAIRILKGM